MPKLPTYRFAHLLLQRWMQSERRYEPGVDTYLQIQQLLDSLPDSLDAERLTTLLTPLLAHQPEEQRQLHQLAKQIREEWEAEAPEKTTSQEVVPDQEKTAENIQDQNKNKGWQIGTILILVGLLALGYGIWQYTSQPPVESQELTVETPEEPAKQNLPGIPDTLTDLADLKPEELLEDKLPAVLQLDTLPLPRIDYSRLQAAPALTRWQRIFANPSSEWLIKGGLILLLAGLLSLILWILRRRRKLIARREHDRRPPFRWDFRPETKNDLVLGQELSLLVRDLKQRTETEQYLLDLPQTIRETARKGGPITFQYRRRTRPPEYLILIDQRNARNHQAQLFNLLYEAFRLEEVHAVRFYFDGDPRVCWNEDYPHKIGLAELHGRYPEHRLLIFGSGYTFMSTRRGRLLRWARHFLQWEERALLTPQPTGAWGRRETQLSKYFVLLPAGLEGLQRLVTQLEAHSREETAGWEELGLKAVPPIQFQGSLRESLEAHFEPNLLRWIAACALWPALHWDLTLFLGDYQGQQETQPLLTLDTLTQLNRLPWFAEGEIPEAARRELIEYLPEEDRNRIRHEIDQVMQQAPPPEGSGPGTNTACTWSPTSCCAQTSAAPNGARSNKNSLDCWRTTWSTTSRWWTTSIDPEVWWITCCPTRFANTCITRANLFMDGEILYGPCRYG